MKEQFYLVSDAVIRVLQQHTYVNNFPFQFQHVIKDQVSYHHQCLLPHVQIPIVQKFKNFPLAFSHDVWKTIEHIRECYYNIRFDTEFNVALY